MNHLLITKGFGPRVRMSAILTNAPLDIEKKAELPFINNACSTCVKCIGVYPAEALTSEEGNP